MFQNLRPEALEASNLSRPPDLPKVLFTDRVTAILTTNEGVNDATKFWGHNKPLRIRS